MSVTVYDGFFGHSALSPNYLGTAAIASDVALFDVTLLSAASVRDQ